MSIWRPLLARAVTLIVVLVAVLLVLALMLGATGYSDRMLDAVVSEQLRAERTALAQTIREPEELERALAARREQLRAFYGLDTPWYFRLPRTMLRVLTLDLGEARTLRSFRGSTRVADIILERLPNTVILLTTALIITAVIGLAVGVKVATQPGSRLDRAISTFAAISYALPTWWVGILLILILSIRLRVLPSGGMYSTPPPIDPLARALDLLWHAALPVLTLVLVSAGPYIYVVRTIALNIAQSEHVALARAKGLPESRVMYRHILRVAAPPIVTGLILGLAGSLGGSVLTETVFNWQGMGRLYYEAVAGTPDESVIVGLTFVFMLIYVVARFILDILYVLLDPRVRYSAE
jgi:peptide/nickel transport system permease protein